MPTEDLIVETLDGSRMPAVLAWPDQAAGPWPVAVVLGELFGLTDVQRDAAERVAALGYLAIAPHLLHRRAPGGPLPEDEGGRARGLALVEELTRLELVSDVRDALDSARARPQADAATTPVAVGLSFGGHVAVLVASQLKLRACVALYAGWLAGTAIAPSRPQPTGSLPLTGPLLVLVGDTDPMVPHCGRGNTPPVAPRRGRRHLPRRGPPVCLERPPWLRPGRGSRRVVAHRRVP